MRVEPYLFFDGRCEEAIEFYKKALGAQVEMMMRFKESPEQHPGMCAPGNEDKIIRAPWQEGAVVSPGTGWFHQHFGTGSVGGMSVRQLALRPSGGQNPLGFRRTVSREGPTVSIRKGGSLVDFDLEDPRVRRDFKAELATKGLPYRMPGEQAS